MIKRLLILLAILITLALITSAQDTEPEVTIEATAEVAAEATAAPDSTPEEEAEEDPECPALVSTALELTQDRCENTAVNEVCYGYVLVETESRTGQTSFNQPGDIVALLDVQTIQMSAMDTRTGQWGVGAFKVEVWVTPEPTAENPNPEAILQDIQFIVFGDTQLSDTGQFVMATADETTSVYYQPNSNGEVISELQTGASAFASARLVGDEWVRIPVALADGETILGWIPVEHISFDIDMTILPELTVEDAANPDTSELNSRFGPMQNFSFRSGVDDAPCSAAPDSAMLIQTPDGMASVKIVVDEVIFELSGTSIVSGGAGGELQFDLLDGEARVTAGGETMPFVEGQVVGVPTNEDGLADGVPTDPVPRDAGAANDILLDLLDDPVDVADPLEFTGVPISGEWALNYIVSTLVCDGINWPLAAVGTVRIEAQQDGLLYAGNFHSETGPATYQGSYTVSNGDTYTNLLQVGTTHQITGTTDIDFASGDCTLNAPFTLQLVDPS